MGWQKAVPMKSMDAGDIAYCEQRQNVAHLDTSKVQLSPATRQMNRISSTAARCGC
jgi:hypothetical protein